MQEFEQLLEDVVKEFNESKAAYLSFSFDHEGTSYTIRLKKPIAPAVPPTAPSPPTKEKEIEAKEPTEPEVKYDFIKSNKIGYFRSTHPRLLKTPLIKGDAVNKGQIVAVVESLGVYHEIRSNISGVVEDILVKDGDAVDYGKPLIKVRIYEEGTNSK